MTDDDDVSPFVSRAPWTEAQVDNLRWYQGWSGMHPFTCGQCSSTLVPEKDGWHCPEDEYTQDWAYTLMTEGEMRPAPGPLGWADRAIAWTMRQPVLKRMPYLPLWMVLGAYAVYEFVRALIVAIREPSGGAWFGVGLLGLVLAFAGALGWMMWRLTSVIWRDDDIRYPEDADTGHEG